MSLIRRRTAAPVAGESRYSFQAWVDDAMKYGGNLYALPQPQTTWTKRPAEQISSSFPSYVGQAFAADAVVYAIELKRVSIFSEARFQFTRRTNGRPGPMFGTQDLTLLEQPWTGGTTGDLLARMILDADLAGNAYWAVLDGELVRLRPDWVEIFLAPRMAQVGPNGETRQVGWTREGYIYYEGGAGMARGDTTAAAVFLPSEICHFAPMPDPLATYRGMSWLTPVVREITADKTATDHQIQYLEHGGTPNMVITLPRETTKQQFDLFKESYKEQHGTVYDAYKPLFLTAGADATLVGSNMQQLDMKALRGLGETRIAMAGGIHPVVLGSSEGMAGSSLNAGNYQAARRSTADSTFRPLWRNVAASLQTIITPPTGAELVYDTREIAFLREDVRDEAEIKAKEAQTLRTLLDAGFTPDSAQAAIVAGDWGLLVHSGFFSVQLQELGATAGDQTTTPATTQAVP